MEYIKLNSGEKMPLVGTGTNTYGKEENQYRGELLDDIPELKKAIELGYRSIDAAISYNNEELVGKVILNSGVPREEFFITTKIPPAEEYTSSKEATRAAIDNSLKNFGGDYLDLLLIHHPIENKEHFHQTWEVFEEYYKEGKIKSIGVSNFDQELLGEMEQFATVKPAVNQIQVNLIQPNHELIEHLLNLDIVPVSWGPMKVEDSQKEVLAEIGKSYHKSWAQVLLRYQTQRGVVVIPKSHNQNNQAANMNIFDFELTDSEMDIIRQL